MSSREKLILEMLNRADARLQAQQQLAIASDARAMQLVAVLIASAAVTMAIADEGSWPVKFAIVLPLIIAAVCGIYAARPVPWHAPGMQPSAFESDLEQDRDYLVVAVELAGHLEADIAANNRILERNADAARLAAILAIFAPIFGLVASIAT